MLPSEPAASTIESSPRAPSASESAFGAPALAPSDVPPSLSKISRYDREGRFRASLAVPDGWADNRLEDGMSGKSFGIISRPADKTAVVIVIDHAAVDESLVEFGAGRWLGISGGVTAIRWGEIEPAGDGLTLRRGEGKLWGKPAELTQVRRRVPSAANGPDTLLLLGAVATSAPKERRDAYRACLASYASTSP